MVEIHAALFMNRERDRALSNPTQDRWRELIASYALRQKRNTSSEQTHTYASGQTGSSASEQMRDSASEQTQSSGVGQTDNQAGYEFQPAEADENGPSKRRDRRHS